MPIRAKESVAPYLILLPLNDTFEPKSIKLPFLPDVVRIGRQTNKTTTPFRDNAYFDSKVLSRAHAELWANSDGRACIKDIRSSNGTFVNGVRLSKENEESEPRELLAGDTLELGIDILNDETGTIIHRKVSARVDHAGLPSDERQKSYEAPSNGTAQSTASGTNGRSITVDMVIRRLNNDLKVSKQVAADLRQTSDLFSNSIKPKQETAKSQLQLAQREAEEKSARIKQLEEALLQERELRLELEERMRAEEDIKDTSSDATEVRGTDEVSPENGNGSIERLENLLREKQEELEMWKARAEKAESENTSKSSRIMELLTQIDTSPTDQRNTAVVSAFAVVMLGVGLMSFLNDYMPKRDF